MTNLIVISFKDEARVIEASHKLNELESLGDITIYEKVIVKKDQGGKITEIQRDTSEGLRVASGATLGTLVGAIGGPVGMLVGMFSGSLAGTLAETDYDDFSEDFMAKVNRHLQPGTSALMAEVEEDNPVFIDTSLSPLGVSIFRADVDDVYDEYEDDQVEAMDKDIAAQRAKLKAAAAKDKANFQKKITDLKDKRKKRIADLKTHLSKDRKTRLEDKIHKHEERIAKLQQQLHDMEA
jgi:uncharacterized membrane protein